MKLIMEEMSDNFSIFDEDEVKNLHEPTMAQAVVSHKKHLSDYEKVTKDGKKVAGELSKKAQPKVYENKEVTLGGKSLNEGLEYGDAAELLHSDVVSLFDAFMKLADDISSIDKIDYDAPDNDSIRDLFDEEYPFEKSFDEVCWDVQNWLGSIEEKIRLM